MPRGPPDRRWGSRGPGGFYAAVLRDKHSCQPHFTDEEGKMQSPSISMELGSEPGSSAPEPTRSQARQEALSRTLATPSGRGAPGVRLPASVRQFLAPGAGRFTYPLQDSVGTQKGLEAPSLPRGGDPGHEGWAAAFHGAVLREVALWLRDEPEGAGARELHGSQIPGPRPMRDQQGKGPGPPPAPSCTG